ncbi:hypothetical protein JTE90_010615 [Oedothorax gibbosus]|uniref:Uncharacterized protein n=1 Tax=Oedothorax gibbosus TaxID=931172 RepID=A0AAV6TES1_9ARAC|nr:hypothetical protein JTE90_010615 [Oedothorax gibbosus]
MSASYPEGNLEGKPAIDGFDCLTPLTQIYDRFARQNRTGPHQSFLGLVLSGHSSPSFGSQSCAQKSAPFPKWKRRVPVRPPAREPGGPQCGPTSAACLSFRRGLIQDP